ncbi:MAG: endonuclease, partial [Alphaproteobacteria bacterium]|nr:endonuclease [Alphaproteobacteria bacterium]
MTRDLRLASFNIESLDDGPHAPPLPERAAILRPQLLRLDADVLCLQEVNGQRDRPRAPRRLRALDALLDGTPYADFARVHTVREGAAGGGASALDRHNLVVLSRLPIRAHRQVQHHLVRPPAFAPPSLGAGAPVRDLTWDRPLLHVALDLGPRTLHVLNLHLRAPRAAFVEGQKRAGEWRSMGAWA